MHSTVFSITGKVSTGFKIDYEVFQTTEYFKKMKKYAVYIIVGPIS